MIKKLINILTPSRWETIWLKKLQNGYCINNLTGVKNTITVFLKIQVSNKGKWRCIITDGVTIQYYDADIVFAQCPSAAEALAVWRRNKLTRAE
jgi:hypothetical protein